MARVLGAYLPFHRNSNDNYNDYHNFNYFMLMNYNDYHNFNYFISFYFITFCCSAMLMMKTDVIFSTV